MNTGWIMVEKESSILFIKGQHMLIGCLVDFSIIRVLFVFAQVNFCVMNMFWLVS